MAFVGKSSAASRAWLRTPSILVVEDDEAVRLGLCGGLRRVGYEVIEAESVAAACRAIAKRAPDAVVSDLRIPDGDAFGLLPRVRELHPTMPVFIVTGHGTIDLAVRAVKSGADDFLTKPVELDHLTRLLERALGSLSPTALGVRAERTASGAFESRSRAMVLVEEQVERLRHADCPVLLLGETGTGKSVLARRIHQVGARAAGPFVDINCAGLTREFVESELFGHERGAFTGAMTTKPGLLDTADGGSLFLDEIGDLDAQVQPKLLKVLEEKRFRRMGDIRERAVDVRLIGATHHDLHGAIAAKTFRADLYYRISTVTITLPALRERREDIVPLARHLLGELSIEEVDLAPDAERALLDYPWPGNLRELRNVLERALLARHGAGITAADVRFDMPSNPRIGLASPVHPGEPEAPPRTLVELEREHITRALAEAGGRVAAAAQRLGIPRSTLYQRMKEYGIRPTRSRGSSPPER